MKNFPLIAIACLLVACPPLNAADSANEAEQMQILQSNASPREKDAACALLKRIGTARCVPVLAALLTDEQLSHSARYALESLNAPAAGKALIDALPRTSGLMRVGIIASLGVRKEKDAAGPLADFVKDSDNAVAAASARALGRIGGPVALKALQSSARSSSGAVRDAVDEGLLAVADGIRQEGQASGSLKIYEAVYATGGQEHTRAAAYRGILLASGRKSVSLMKDALLGQPGPAQSAVLQLVHELGLPGVTAAVCDVLPKVPPALQVALIGGLGQRGDNSACPAIAALLPGAGAETRVAACEALSLLGDGKVVQPIAELAANSTGSVQSAARQALVQLRPADVNPVMLTLLSRAAPGVQSELARALGERSANDSVPKLIELARQGQGTAPSAACQALTLLAQESNLPALTELVKMANNEEQRARTAETLNSVMQRVLKEQGHVDTSPLLQGIASGPREGRLALLPICSGLTDPAVRDALRRGLNDPDPQLRGAYVRVVCDTTDHDLLPELLALTVSAPDDSSRTLAVRACVRLVREDERSKLPSARKLEIYRQLLERNVGREGTRSILGGLSDLPDQQALTLVEPFLQDAALQAEAARAVIKIASTVPDADAASAALRKVTASVADPSTREAAAAALKSIEARSDYITSWKVAGPFRQNGQNYAALFDTVFPPEASGGQAGEWRLLPPCGDPKRPWSMDLLAALGGEQVVAYGKTWVYNEQETPAVAEIGSDDGIKVWLNEALVHAHNVARALTPGADKASVTLKKGWNLLLVKVTQNNLGWEFSLRLTKPDGARLPDLRTDPNHVPGL